MAELPERSWRSMGLFTVGRSAKVAQDVTRVAYIGAPDHPAHKSFTTNYMVRTPPAT